MDLYASKDQLYNYLNTLKKIYIQFYVKMVEPMIKNDFVIYIIQ